jgi:hypothetical protein
MPYTTIKKPSDYFNTVLYTGDGTSPRSITGVGFQPDFLWIKDRSNAYEHRLMDAVRGSNKVLHSSANTAESSEEYYTVSSFDSDGWTGRSGTGTNQVITGGNDNGDNFVAWNWLASNTTASNTDGSITSTVSANTTSGFSIVSYTGTGANATIGHGLGSAPQVVLIKERNGTNNWLMSHQPLSASLGDYTRFMVLNSTSAVSGAGNIVFQSSAFTSSVFNVGTSAGSNGSGQNYIAYCFSEKQGFSKFGLYTGNGDADGTFVYTGFKPAMVILKDYSSASNYNWIILDNKRDPSNSLDLRLQPSSVLAEYTDVSDFCDFTSNGFKWRGSQGNWNASGVGYIYMAFAEEPLVGDNPAPAR